MNPPIQCEKCGELSQREHTCLSGPPFPMTHAIERCKGCGFSFRHHVHGYDAECVCPDCRPIDVLLTRNPLVKIGWYARRGRIRNALGGSNHRDRRRAPGSVSGEAKASLGTWALAQAALIFTATFGLGFAVGFLLGEVLTR